MMRGIYKVPMGPVLKTLENVLRTGTEIKRKYTKYPYSVSNPQNELSFEFDLSKWVEDTQKSLDNIYKTPKQSNDFSDLYKFDGVEFTFSSGINPFRKSHEEIMEVLNEQLSFINNLWDNANEFDEKLMSESKGHIPKIIPTPTTVHIGDNVTGDKVGRDKNIHTKDEETTLNKIIVGVAIIVIGVIALYTISKLTGVDLKGF